MKATGFKRYFFNTSWLMAEQILRKAVAFFVIIYLARYLGAEKLGILAYAQCFVGLFSILASLGLDPIVVRELLKTPEKRDLLLGTALILKIAGVVAMWVCMGIGLCFIDNARITIFIICIIAAGVIFQTMNVVDYYFQARVLSKYVVYVQSVQGIVSAAIKLLLIYIGAPLLWFAWVFFFDSLVLGAGLFLVYRWKRGKISTWCFQMDTAKKLLVDSWPIALSGMAIAIYNNVDRIMLKEMAGMESVGIYSAAAQISFAWFFIPAAIANSLFPAIMNAKKTNEELYFQRLQTLYDFSVSIALAIVLPIAFFSIPLTVALYGDAYILSGSVLSFHIWSVLFAFLGMPSGKYLLVENLQLYALFRNASGLTVNIIANYVLIKSYGVVGAAIATLLAVATSFYISYLIFPKTRLLFEMHTKSLLGGHYRMARAACSAMKKTALFAKTPKREM